MPPGATIGASGLERPRQEFFRTEGTIVKRFLVCTALAVVATALSAQKAPPKSPLATASVTVDGKTVSVTYSSPRLNGRAGHIFDPGGLISRDPTYPVWRAGANAATALHTDADLILGGMRVPKGDYTLYVDIADPGHWVLIVNKETGQWGTRYDKALDLGQVKMKMSRPLAPVENLQYTLENLGGTTGKLTLKWENRSASVLFAVH